MSKLRTSQIATLDDTVTVNVSDLLTAGTLSDTAIPVKLDATGSVSRTQHGKNSDFVTAEDFGAIGDGTLHPLSEKYTSLATAQAVYPHVTALSQSIDWAALQAAINFSSSSARSVKLIGHYIINSTLNFDVAGAEVYGWRTWSYGASIAVASDYNDVMISITKTVGLSQLRLKGPTTSQSSNVLIKIADSNAVRMDSVFFESGYRQLLITGTSFYISINDCDFYGSLYSALETSSTSYSGVDLIMSHCRFLAHTGLYVVCFNGLGSALISDVQASVNEITQATLYFGTFAEGYGGCQMTNCVWENGSGVSAAVASVYIKGTSALPGKSIWFDNCIITGNGVPAVLIFYATGVKFSTCGLSSTSATGVVYWNATGTGTDVCFDGCEWSTSGSNAPVRMGAVTLADVTLTNCTYIGSNAFVDVASAAYATIRHVNVINSYLGGGTAPVSKTSDGYWPNGQILTTGHQLGGFTKVTATISTDASGSASVAHYVYNAQKRVALLTAVAKGSSGEAVGTSTATLKVDGGSLYVVGGPTSGKVRITALFNEAEDSGW